MFHHNPNRDAYATIKGYVYQVDTTLVRWLALPSGRRLQLECGEDIDEVSRSINGQESRVAEQVKHREANPSLNQVGMLEILLNFFEHQQRNPGYTVSCRYLTNAPPALEKPAFFDTGEKGMDIWMALRNPDNRLDDSFLFILQKKLKDKVGSIAKEIGNKTPGAAQEQKRWNALDAAIGERDQFLQLIRDVEWITHAPGAEAVNEQVLIELENRYGCDRTEAHLRYARLFLYVFKLLSKEGLKELTAEVLEDQMQMTALSATDTALIELLQKHLLEVTGRFDKVESTLSEHSAQLRQVVSGLGQVRQMTAHLQFDSPLLSTAPPSVIARGSRREDKVKALQSQLDNYPWVHIHGTYGTGKTQLAVLLAATLDNIRWLDLAAHKRDVSWSASLLMKFLAQLSDSVPTGELRYWIKIMFNKLPRGTLLVLNDIPSFSRNDRLFTLLSAIVEGISGTGVQLVTTSNYQLPTLFTRQYPAVQSVNDLAFSDPEIEEFMQACGAPVSTLKLVPMIASVSQRHAQLVAAVIYHLQSKTWSQTVAQTYLELLSESFKEDVVDEAQDAIIRFIDDQGTRELLYRLSIVHYGILEEDIRAIAAVPEVITHINERLMVLRYTWLRVTAPYLEVSPVIYDIGKRNLPATTIRSVYGAMGEQLIARKKLSPLSATQAISAFIQAGEPDKAGSVLINVYRTAENPTQANVLKQWHMLAFFSDVEFPDSMSRSMQAAIISEQVRLMEMLGEDSVALRGRLRTLSQLPGLSDQEAFQIHAQLISVSHQIGVADFIHHFKEVLSIWPRYRGEEMYPVTPSMLSTSFWIPVERLATEKEIRQWLQLAAIIEKELHIDVFADSFAPMALAYLAQRLVTEGLENADAAFRVLSPLILWFRERGLSALEAIFFKEIVSIRFMMLKDPEGAVELAEERLALWKPEAHQARYVLFDELARTHFTQGLRNAGQAYVAFALAEAAGQGGQLADTHLLAATLYAPDDTALGTELLELACEIAESDPDYPPVIYTQLLSESAIGYWLNGQHEKSIASFETAVDRLLAVPVADRDAYWRKLVYLTAGSINHIGVKMGRPYVSATVAGVRESMRPFVGVISFYNKPIDIEEGFLQNHEAIIYVHLSMYAEGTGNISTAYRLSGKAQDYARQRNNSYALHLAASVFREHALIQFKAAEALESAILHAAAHTHLTGSLTEKQDQLKTSNMRSMLATKPSAAWNEAEQMAVEQAVAPLMLHVFTAMLRGDKDASSKREQLLQTIREYASQSSDRNLWEQTDSIVSGILNGIGTTRLKDMARTYRQHDRRPLEILSILAIIQSAADPKEQVREMINIFPFFTNRFQYSRGIIRFIFVPYAKAILTVSLKAISPSEGAVNMLLDHVRLVNDAAEHPLQSLLQPLAQYFNTQLGSGRDRWLMHYEEI